MQSSRQSKTKRNTNMPEKTLGDLIKMAANKEKKNTDKQDLRRTVLNRRLNKTLKKEASSLPLETPVKFGKPKKPHKMTTKRKPGRIITPENISEIRKESAKLKANMPEFRVIGDNNTNPQNEEEEFKIIGDNNPNPQNEEEEFKIISG